MAKKIALFLENIIGDYQCDIIPVIAKNASELGYELEIFASFGPYGQNYLHEENERRIRNLPSFPDYAGIIIAPDTYNIKGLYEELTDTIENETNCPVVTLRYKDDRFYNILVDDKKSMTGMVEHFVSEHGFRKICFMGGPSERLDAQLRLDSYLEVMNNHDIPVTEHMLFEGDFWKNKGKDAVEWFLSDGLPEAIVCANDYMAISVCKALEEKGYRIPEDVCVSGFDNVKEASFFEPPIATVDISRDDLGKSAVELIDRVNQRENVKQEVYVSVKELYNGSCGCKGRSRNNQIINLYSKSEYLKNYIQQITYMTVDLDNCDTMEELFQTVFSYTYNFSYDAMYICLCDGYDSENMEVEELESYTESMCLRAILSLKDGLEFCEEYFDRKEILPEKYRTRNIVNVVLQLHYKNHCLGYVVLHPNDLTGIKEMFPAWIKLLASYIDKVCLYEMNRHLMDFREEAMRDELTGLNNRRMLEKTLMQRTHKSYTEEVHFYMMSLDMDGLKTINDTYGHLVGDIAICKLADILKEVSCEDVMAARVGGDEFVICVDTAEESRIERLINEINEKIEDYNYKSGKPYQLSTSIGYSSYYQGEEISECMKSADQRMYSVKSYKKRKLS